MRTKLGFWALVLSIAATTAGCGSPPTAAIDEAKTALDQAVAAGAGQYAAEALKPAQEAQVALEAELKTQDANWLKTYTNATKLAATAKAAGERAASSATAGKAKAKAEATAAVGAAKKLLADAQALLAKAPKGKVSAADLAAMKTDLANAATAITDAEAALGGERFVDAKAKAASAQSTATTVKTAVETAQGAKKR